MRANKHRDACAATAAGRWGLSGLTAVKYSSIQAALKVSTWLMLRSTMPAARAVSMRTARCAVSLQPASQAASQSVRQSASRGVVLPYFKTASLQDHAHAAAVAAPTPCVCCCCACCPDPPVIVRLWLNGGLLITPGPAAGRSMLLMMPCIDNLPQSLSAAGLWWLDAAAGLTSSLHGQASRGTSAGLVGEGGGAGPPGHAASSAW